MLLIHNDDPNILKRRKDGGASTQGNLHSSLPDSSPLVISLSSAEPTMKEAEVVSEATFKSREELRG
jgi:hypothetical protein